MKLFNLFLIVFLSSTELLAGVGRVDIVVSEQGMPREAYELSIDEESYKTDSFGFVTTALEEGTHRLSFLNNKELKTIEFTVIEDDRTQLIVNLFQNQASHELLEPEEKKILQKEVGAAKGEIELIVKAVTGEPITGAQFFVPGLEVHQKTDRSGRAAFELPEGTYTISVTHSKFSTQTLRNVKVSRDGGVTRQVELTPAGLVLDDFVVLAPNLKGSIEALIEVRRQSSDVADVMSAEQMAKSGDSDAAGSLKRVTGLTLKDGKYVYVRGLGERYSSTLLNGVALPSPDPSRRVVPLDLFPVQFLDSMVIQKSYSPNQPGEFGGGVVMLETKSMPEKFFFKAAVSQTQNTNDGDMLAGSSGRTDWLGVDDGGRKLPVDARDNPRSILSSNRHSVSSQQNDSLPDFSFSTGDRWKGKALHVGYTLSGLYKDMINYTNVENSRYNEGDGGALRQENDYERKKTQKERTLGGIAGMQFELFKHQKISANYIHLRNTTDYVAIEEGLNVNRQLYREQQSEWAARTLKTVLLQGENKVEKINDLKFKWNFSESKARRDEPYRTAVRYSPVDGEFVYNPGDNRAYQRRYYDLQEKVDGLNLSASMPFPWFYKRKGEIEVGAGRTRKSRSSSMERFALDPSGKECNADLTSNFDQILDQCDDSFFVTRTTRKTDNYFASQQLQSYYFKSQWPLLKNLNLNSGMRFEDSVQSVNSLSQLQSQPELSQLNTKDWLPGSSLTWKMNKKMQARLAYSETISRPDLRELSNTLWQDFDTGYDVQGNPDLLATVINSYDARWEWYFTQRENVSLGFFYKDFKNPIEQVFTAGSDPRIAFQNVEGATLYGAEIETSKNFGFISPWLRRFTLSGNYAYILSNVELGNIRNSESTETSRPLQGQSNYTANFLLDYEHEKWGTNASLAYNVYGKRIVYMGAEGLPNIWELPFHQLDFVMSQRLSQTAKLRFKFKNILNPRTRLVQGDQEWQTWRKGLAITLGVSMEI